MKRAIVYLAWGEKHVLEAVESAKSTSFMQIPAVLLTNPASARLVPEEHPFAAVETRDFDETDRIIKTALWRLLPEVFDSFLFLDVDTRIVMDVTFGFEMAERHGIAMAPAPDYCLENHWGFDKVMEAAGVPCRGQNQYNSGVIFFVRRPDVERIFRDWEKLAYELSQNPGFNRVDQPFLTLAMERAGFNPYMLSANYNYRAIAAEHISGQVRIWHSYAPVPDDLNCYEKTWPPRRYIGDRRIETDDFRRWLDRREQ